MEWKTECRASGLYFHDQERGWPRFLTLSFHKYLAPLEIIQGEEQILLS